MDAVVVTLLLACLTIGSGFDAGAATAPSARQPTAPLTVATFNVLSPRSGVAWKPRRAHVLELIRRARADVVVIQEAEGTTERWLTLVPEARARDLSALWLARKAGLSLAPLYGFTEPPYPDKLYYSRKGPYVLYNPKRLTQLTDQACNHETLGGTVFGTFTDRVSGSPLQIIGLHLTAGTSKASARARIREIREQDRFIRKCSPAAWRTNAPKIWAGDFNTTGKALTRNMRRRGLTDTVTVARKRSHHRLNTFNGRRRPVTRAGVRIDQIWVPRGSTVHSWTQLVNIKRGEYVGRFASDHNPVVARVTLPATPPARR